MESVLQSCLLPAGISLFIAIYSVGYYSLFPRWKHKARFEAASCLMSMVHGAITSTLAAYDILCVPWKLDAPNNPLENGLMDISIAYFAVDLLHYLLFVPEDLKFIFHHLATSIYMLTCKYYTKHGAVSVMALMAVGEVTSPLQSVWTIARLGRDISPLAKKVYEGASLPFTVFFTCTRGIVGPYLTWKLCKFYLSNEARRVIPLWLAASWMVMVVIGMAGSMMWMRSLWIGLRRFNARKKRLFSKAANDPMTLVWSLSLDIEWREYPFWSISLNAMVQRQTLFR